MDNICKICNKPIIERSHAWKNHRVKEKDYYEKYLPKADLFTGEKIEFKNPEQYFLTDFNDKRNLKRFIESSSKESALLYLSTWLGRRKGLKNLVYGMSEFECKSLCFPSIQYIEKYFGMNTYWKLCLDNDLIHIHFYNQLIRKKNKDLEFICDSRERSIIELPNIQIKTLNYGDYTVKNNNGIYIERKSLADAISTLSQGYERFNNEIKRCRENNDYLVILVEEKYSNLQGFEYLPHIRSKCDWVFISHQIRELLYNYPFTIQFLAVDGRKEASRIIESIFKLENDVRKIDLQYYYNKKEL